MFYYLHLFGYNFICLFISYTLKGIVIQKKTVVHASKDNGLFIQSVFDYSLGKVFGLLSFSLVNVILSTDKHDTQIQLINATELSV